VLTWGERPDGGAVGYSADGKRRYVIAPKRTGKGKHACTVFIVTIHDEDVNGQRLGKDQNSLHEAKAACEADYAEQGAPHA